MENDEQALLHGFMEEGGDYELGDVSEEEEDEEDVHLPAENQDAGTQEGDLDQSGVDAEEALPRAHTEQFSTPVTESFAVSQQLGVCGIHFNRGELRRFFTHEAIRSEKCPLTNAT